MKPTAKELLDSFGSCKGEDRNLAVFQAERLAVRVEKVLAYCRNAREHWNNSPERDAALAVERRLNGEDL